MSDLRASTATRSSTTSGTASGTATAVVVDARSRTNAEAEHLLHQLEAALREVPGAGAHPTWASTHVVAAPPPRVVLVLSWGATGPAAHEVRSALRALTPAADVLVLDAAQVADAVTAAATGSPGPEVAGPLDEPLHHHVGRAAGRLVRFPGSEDARGVVTVADLVRATCVDEVAALAGTELSDASVLDLGDFHRPTWQSGRCVLLVQQARHALVPFEAATQRACCSEH